MTTPLDRALAEADRLFPQAVERLKALVAIPSCGFPGFDHRHVHESARATAAWLADAGWPQVRVQEWPGALPYVIASDRRAGPGRPTLLLYAHHDVQPPLREHLWLSPPHQATVRDGRLYGRGAADDKAGVLLHAAAVQAWVAAAGAPPVNLVALIEGEEECGSHAMGAFLAANRAELACDALVIADLANVDTGLPSITTSLRGHVGLEIEVRALRAPLHSGMWGGAVPDCVQALCRAIGSLARADGSLDIPGLHDRVRPATAAERAQWASLPIDPARLAEQAGLPAGAAMPPLAELCERLWRRPSLAVNAIQAGERGRTGNVIMDSAWARLGIRIVPDQRPDEVEAQLIAALRARLPAGLEVSLRRESFNAPWGTDTGHAAFAAARRALAIGYGREPVEIGCGASIPFVAEMSALLGGVPALLVGVEDPQCGAHAENESVDLGDLRKAVRSEVALLAEAASLAAGRAAP